MLASARLPATELSRIGGTLERRGCAGQALSCTLKPLFTVQENRMRPSLRRLSGLALAGLLLTLGLVASRSEAEPPASSTPTPSVDTAEALRLSYYQYDAGLPLNAALKPLDTTDTSKRFSLAYDS